MSLIDRVAISRQAKHRLRQILKMRKQKMTMEDIGLALNISKQRVSHILKKANGKT
jgi:DNA-directed RNA polymerase specialized sigma subunit